MFVELPAGFKVPNKVLLLQKYVYGLKHSPLNFYRHLRSVLESRGFEKSAHDDCLFTNGTVMILFWVDDAIFYAKSKKIIDDVILSLKDIFLLERDKDMARFLGTNISRSKYGSKDGSKDVITMTQTGLIDRILRAMDMLDSNPKYTPADKNPLQKDLIGEPWCEELE